MRINDIEFTSTLSDVISELQNQLRMNQIPLIQKIKEGPTHIQIQCPYHGNGQERKPSAGIRKSDGIFHCFACGEVHSLQEVISHCFGHYDDIVGAFGWNWLLKNFLTIKVEERKDVELDFGRNNLDSRLSDRSKNSNDALGFVSEEELDSYRYIHPYMYERKLTDEIIEMFDIGYDKQSECITFPVRDINGNTLFIARRSVKTKFFNYPEGVEKPVYGVYELMRMSTRKFKELFPNEFMGDSLIICESMIDALTCWVYGKPAVALNGLGNELQFKQLNQMPFRQFILATDNDEAGLRARERIRKNIKGKLIKEFLFPEGRKDINELSKDEFDRLQEIF